MGPLSRTIGELRMGRRSELEGAYTADGEDRAFWESRAAGGLSDAERRAVESMKLKLGDSVLVVGCGSGRESRALAEMGYRVVGVDLVSHLLLTARGYSKIPGRCSYVAGDWARLPFRSSSFHAAVIISQTSGHLPTPSLLREALRETARVIRPDGSVLLNVFNRGFKNYPVSYLLWRAWKAASGGHPSFSDAVSEATPGNPLASGSRVASSRVRALWRVLFAAVNGQLLRLRISGRVEKAALIRLFGRIPSTNPRDVYISPRAQRVRFAPGPGLARYHLYTPKEFADAVQDERDLRPVPAATGAKPGHGRTRTGGGAA